MKTLQMVDLVSQSKPIKKDILEGIESLIDEAQYIGGQVVTEFSEALEQQLEVKHVIPCANGTDALQIALMALGLEPGDEVICPSFTFVATAEIARLLNLKISFIDVDYQTFNLDIDQLEGLISDKTKAIIPVHLFGQMTNMEELMKVAKAHGLFVVEDTAQSIGSWMEIDGKKQFAGTIGDIGTTSFFPSKNLGAYGDAGALYTNNKALAQRIKKITNHGMSKRYHYDCIGVNSRLDAFQAIVLKVKLKHFDSYLKQRRWAADQYDRMLSPLEDVQCPVRNDFSFHVFHQYTLRISNGKRDDLHAKLTSLGIPNMIYYPVPIHKQAAYAEAKCGSMTQTEQLSKEVLSLPMHTELELNQIEYICKAISDFISTSN
ncbi:MAG: DegT/DnrJ/EryC1/StrS family aminotransferase [Flavobacteriales bacterium]